MNILQLAEEIGQEACDRLLNSRHLYCKKGYLSQISREISERNPNFLKEIKEITEKTQKSTIQAMYFEYEIKNLELNEIYAMTKRKMPVKNVHYENMDIPQKIFLYLYSYFQNSKLEIEKLLLNQSQKMPEQAFFLAPPYHNEPVILPPRSEIQINALAFLPSSTEYYSSSLLVKNNLSIICSIPISGHGGQGKIVLSDKKTRISDTNGVLFLDFEEEDLAKHAAIRILTVQNNGNMPLAVERIQECESQGLKILDCKGFVLKSDEAKDLVINYEPDYSSFSHKMSLKFYSKSEIYEFRLVMRIPYSVFLGMVQKKCEILWALEPALLIIATLILARSVLNMLVHYKGKNVLLKQLSDLVMLKKSFPEINKKIQKIKPAKAKSKMNVAAPQFVGKPQSRVNNFIINIER